MHIFGVQAKAEEGVTDSGEKSRHSLEQSLNELAGDLGLRGLETTRNLPKLYEDMGVPKPEQESQECETPERPEIEAEYRVPYDSYQMAPSVYLTHQPLMAFRGLPMLVFITWHKKCTGFFSCLLSLSVSSDRLTYVVQALSLLSASGFKVQSEKRTD